MPQKYVSGELTHFVGRSAPTPEDAYLLLLKILEEELVSHPPHVRGISGNLSIQAGIQLSSNEMYAPEIVCFCDIPLEDLAIHMQKYAQFGLSFQKAFAAERGAAPVRYIPRETKVHASGRIAARLERLRAAEPSAPPSPSDLERLREKLDERIALADLFDWGVLHYQELLHRIGNEYMNARLERFKAGDRTDGPIAPEFHELDDLERFLDFHVFSFLKFFEVGLEDDDPENFYMEREWRIVGNLEFKLADVHRVIIPAAYEPRFREDVPAFRGAVTPVRDEERRI